MNRPIKSYVLRAGRISPRQQRGLDIDLAQFELLQEPWCLASLFGRKADTIVEIGFGMGASLLMTASHHPEINFIGIEVHRAGIGSLSASLHEKTLSNVRIAPLDAVEVFTTCLPDASLAGVQIFFPDPWPKKRHHKRRLIQPELIQHIIRKIKPGGYIHCATDWQDYAHHMLAVLSAAPHLRNTNAQGGFSKRPETRPLTKFEQRGQRLGHDVWDLIFIATQPEL